MRVSTVMAPDSEIAKNPDPKLKARSYRSPRLIIYGTVSTLTGTASKTAMEDGMGADVEAMT